MSYNKAIFLDRDGTIVKEIPPSDFQDKDTFGYLTDVSQVELIEGSAKAIGLAHKIGFKVIVVSNQSAIARGWLTEETLRGINDEMYKQLLKEDSFAKIDDFFFSPFHIEAKISKYKKDHSSRKPNIGMILEAKEKYNLNLAGSYLIGDSYTDMKCAENAGTKKILVLTGYGKKTYQKCNEENLKIDFIANNLWEAVKFVESEEC